MKNLLLILIFIFPSSIFANCNDLLKLEISKRLGVKSYLFSRHIIKMKADKLEEFELNLGRFQDLKEIIYKKTAEDDLNFVNAFDFGVIPLEFIDPLFMLRIDINNIQRYKEWLGELFDDVIIELYITKNQEMIRRFESDGKISKDIIIKVILERSKEGGFSGKEEDIEIIGDILEDNEFSDVLFKKKYIYDYYQQDSPHGDMVHMFNLDFIIFSLRKNNYPTYKASQIYQWFGEYVDIKYSDGELLRYFNPLNDVWGKFFDTTDFSLTSPELLNGKFIRFFGIDQNELPSYIIKQGYY